MANTARAKWIEANAAAAQQATAGSRIFPTLLLAQAIVESSGLVNGYYVPGESLLSKNYNNYFGIKASSQWRGKTVTLNTGEVVNGRRVVIPGTFRVYDSVKDSFADFVSFLKTNPRYTTAGVFTATTPSQQAERIAAAGYATDPNYANILKSIIKSIDSIKPALFPIATVTALLLLLIFLKN
jgi:flagellum-specific peptidoglycan hydrolase FlgJ